MNEKHKDVLTAAPTHEGCVACLADVSVGTKGDSVLTCLSMLIADVCTPQDCYRLLCVTHRRKIDNAIKSCA